MIMYEDLMKAVQDDARRAGERDRLLLEARRARRARRRRLVPAAPVRRRTEMGKIVVSENVALDEALAAGAFLLGRRSYEWLAARWPSRSGELAARRRPQQ
jgi:hypothetical protein